MMQLDPAQLSACRTFETIDAHTEGEPLRIITRGYPAIPGETMLAKRRYLQQHLDDYRRLLMHEPRGHADMYGVLVTEPVEAGSDFGVLFLHNEGYSSMCGHGIIAVCKVAVTTGFVSAEQFPHNIRIDSPAGLISAWVEPVAGKTDGLADFRVWFDNVPSFAEALDHEVEVPGLGRVTCDIGFGGAYYAYVDADQLGIDCTPANVAELIHQGRAIKQAVISSLALSHPRDEDLGFLYGTIFHSRKTSHPKAHSRHVCIFADGEVDRSPTGTGVSGRAALLHARGELPLGETLTIESIVDGRMTVSALRSEDFHGKPAVIPRVSGSAYITGIHQFLLDANDKFPVGFMLR